MILVLSFIILPYNYTIPGVTIPYPQPGRPGPFAVPLWPALQAGCYTGYGSAPTQCGFKGDHDVTFPAENEIMGDGRWVRTSIFTIAAPVAVPLLKCSLEGNSRALGIPFFHIRPGPQRSSEKRTRPAGPGAMHPRYPGFLPADPAGIPRSRGLRQKTVTGRYGVRPSYLPIYNPVTHC